MDFFQFKYVHLQPRLAIISKIKANSYKQKHSEKILIKCLNTTQQQAISHVENCVNSYENLKTYDGHFSLIYFILSKLIHLLTYLICVAVPTLVFTIINHFISLDKQMVHIFNFLDFKKQPKLRIRVKTKND